MVGRLREWLRTKWARPVTNEAADRERLDLIHAYGATFNSVQGQQVLSHLVDTIYCQIYEGTNPNEALAHNARRAVVHEILQNLDYAESPMKYELPKEAPHA